MRVLIAGAAGFLGSHLCDRFHVEGCDVVAVDSLLTGSESNLSHLAGRPRFELLRHDVTRPLRVEGAIDGILHFASTASPPDYLRYPIHTLATGSMGTHHLLGLAREKGARFLMASTSEVYGDPERHPQPESYWGNVNPVGPRAVYDEAKRYAEALTMAYRREHGVDTRIVRIFNTYGPRMRPTDGRVVSNFIMQALQGLPLTVYGDGSQTRSFCHVDDLVEGIHRVFLADHPGPINLGNPDEFTILQLAEEVRTMVGSSARISFGPLPEDDPKLRRPDISLADRLLGWKPEVSLHEGLRRTVPYFAALLNGNGRRDGAGTAADPRREVAHGD